MVSSNVTRSNNLVDCSKTPVKAHQEPGVLAKPLSVPPPTGVSLAGASGTSSKKNKTLKANKSFTPSGNRSHTPYTKGDSPNSSPACRMATVLKLDTEKPAARETPTQHNTKPSGNRRHTPYAKGIPTNPKSECRMASDQKLDSGCSVARETPPLHSSQSSATKDNTPSVEGNPSSNKSVSRMASEKQLETGNSKTRDNPDRPSKRGMRRAAYLLYNQETLLAKDSSVQMTQQLEWARTVIPDFRRSEIPPKPKRATNEPLPSTSKRNRSLDSTLPTAKRSKVISGKTFAEVAKDKILLGVVNRGSPDGTFPKSEWQAILTAINVRYLSFMREHGGPPPIVEDVGWHQGRFKTIACSDAQSAEAYKKMVAGLGEVFPGARLEAVNWDQIPRRPRASVWLTHEPSSPKDILDLLGFCNPQLRVKEWNILRVMEPVGKKREVILSVDEDTVRHLKTGDGRVVYGGGRVFVRVYKQDSNSIRELTPADAAMEELSENQIPEEEDPLTGYSSDLSDLASHMGKVGVEDDLLLTDPDSDAEGDTTMVEVLPNVADISADKPPSL